MTEQPSIDFGSDFEPRRPLTKRELLDRSTRRMPPHQRHSSASKDAARDIKKARGPLHVRILDLLNRHPAGLTDEQIQEMEELNPSTQRPRRIELLAAGMIEPAPETRKTRSGRSATVWRRA